MLVQIFSMYFSELMKLQELMKLRNQNNIKITLQQYTTEFQYNKILKDIRKKGETNIVLEVPTNRIKDVLTEAQKAGMLTEYHNYLITTLVSICFINYTKHNYARFYEIYFYLLTFSNCLKVYMYTLTHAFSHSHHFSFLSFRLV